MKAGEEERATTELYEELRKQPANAAFRQLVDSPVEFGPPQVDLVGIVRGAFHQEHRGTGADGARVLALVRELGLQAELILTPSFGTLEESAGAILSWLQQHGGRRIALVSLSKGSAEVKRALASPQARPAFAAVSAWISLSGMSEGTPLVEWLRQRPLRWWGVRTLLWWKGHAVKALEDLHHGEVTAWPPLPAGLRVVHVFGFPLPHHLAHPWAARAYARLSSLGPNDGGGILLATLSSLPGVVYPIWGADHYLAPDWNILPLLRRIFQATLSRE